MKIAALTDIGSCRQENQDNYCARQLVDEKIYGDYHQQYQRAYYRFK